jgi:hypothetical protein
MILKGSQRSGGTQQARLPSERHFKRSRPSSVSRNVMGDGVFFLGADCAAT